ncbi:DUF6777 domain-containing protein, partial [Streptomyces sp. NPDC051219]|uniref:DUF6777 domain-containing protein n=1 Tax=Streptomyces sp. NPDC051219 TaxID=3155283 RepID=UPI003412DB3D
MSASTAVVVVTAVIVAFTVMGGGSKGGGEIFLQAAAAAGPDPFTPSTARQAEGTPTPGTAKTGGNGTRTLQVNGAHPGLYGGTRNVASCDVEKQIKFLTENKDKGKAFAGASGIQQADIPSHLRSLTPVRLSWDTRVTNHGYKDKAATSNQAILQAGTAVLVDDRAVPRVRCACGNPLSPPVAVEGKQKYTGRQWSSFRPSSLVAVAPAEKPMKTVTMFDQDRKGWFERPSGDHLGRGDHEVPPPKGQTPGSEFPVLPPPSSGSLEESPDNEDKDEDRDKKRNEDGDGNKKKDDPPAPPPGDDPPAPPPGDDPPAPPPGDDPPAPPPGDDPPA